MEKGNMRRTGAGLAFGFFTLVALLMPSSYLVHTAGPTLAVNGQIEDADVVTISGTQTYSSETDFLLTTVSSAGNADSGIVGAGVLGALLTTSAEVVPVRAYYPAEVSAVQVWEQNLELMSASQHAAATVALERAGLPVVATLEVTGVFETSPAYGKVEVGDQIRAITVSGKTTEVQSFVQLSAVLDTVAPGTTVELGVDRAGERQVVQTTTGPYEEDSTGWLHPGSLLGVFVAVRDVQLPAEVDYIVDGIGGPSAGVMFGLGIYDALTEGSLGGSRVIAGTGALAWDGEVEPIGGIRHKLSGAKDAGAQHFILPATNCADTEGYVPSGLQLWPVRSLDEAIAVVEAINSEDTAGLPTCPSK